MTVQAVNNPHALDWVRVPEQWPGQADLLVWCQNMGAGMAAMLILLGIVYLLFGFYLFKALVMINATILGIVVGAKVGEKAGAMLPGGVLGGVLAATITWPLMKYAVAAMGAVFGALLGGSVWRAFDLEPRYVLAGSMTGAVFFGLLCFILFRGCVMMYTSLQGSVMVIFGVIGLIYKYPNAASQVRDTLLGKPFLLPVILFVATVLGIIYQQRSNPPAKA